MVESARGWAKNNSGLLLFLAAQFIALGGAGAAAIGYFTRLAVRVTTMEERGAAYTVSRMDEMKLRIQTLESKNTQLEARLERIVDIMTKKLQISP